MAEQPDLFQPNPQEKLAEHHVRNQKLFSSYYLAYKLPERSLWQALEPKAREAFEAIKQAYHEMAAANLFAAKNEAETERVFIRPSLKALGFEHFSVQPSLDSYDAKLKPDYALFPDRESYEAAQRERENMRVFYGKAVAIAEAKYWGRPMNDPDPSDPADTSDATKQLVGYLRDVAEWTDGKTRWGILTNGKLWRLFCRRADYTAENYVEIDLEAIISGDNFEAFKYFYALFSRDAFVPDPVEGVSWLESYLKGSEEYSSAITQRLKDLIFEKVFDCLAEGFVRYRRERLGVTHEDDLTKRVIYQGCLTLLYRLLFLLNAESRQLLPLDNPGYRERSLRALMERIWEEREQPRDPSHDFEYWTHLERLFHMMDEGAPTFNLPKYNGGLFKRPNPGTPLEELREEEIGPWFLETHKLSDPYLRDVIERLTFDPEAPPGARAFIDYSSLGVRHLGEIYEGLLEFKIEIAEDEPVCAVGSRSQSKWKKQSEVEPGETVHVTKEIGHPYITNDKGERKATGSYYTPHYIVEYIVEHTIGPQLKRFEQEKEWYDRILGPDTDLQALYQEIMEKTVSSEDERERLDTLWRACRNDEERRDFLLRHLDPEWGYHQFDPATRALELKVLDPAMGSGHFLVHAVDVIADRVADFLHKYPESPVSEQLERLRESILRNVREQGVQIDESKLNDVNLIKRMVMKRCIYGVDLNPMAVELAKLSLWLDSFTVGAPLSFLDHHLKCGNSLIGAIDVSKHLPPGSQREKEFQRAVANLLLVADLTDATISEVEQSQRLYEEAQGQLEPTKRRVNVELAKHFMDISDTAVGQAMDYAYKDQEQLKPNDEHEKVRIENYRRAQEIARQKRFFHWELEFPEVWYTKRGRRSNPGFDAVIGNPPYVRQEQITPNKDYFSAVFAVYRSTADLYVYFYEIAHRLLRPGGVFGMITSNKFMRAAYGRPLRRFLAQGVYVRQIIDFGDLPVFPDASAYPCIVITSKEEREGRLTAYLRVPALEFGALDRFVKKNAMPLPAEAFQDEHWQLSGAIEHQILRKMEEVSVPLERWLGDVEIRRGVLTGFNEAFFIDEETRERLIEQDPKSAEIIKPLVVGDDIKRYEIEFKGRYLIWTYIGVPIEKYPAIFDHLKQYREQLERRWDKGEHWWELRHCDYYEDFEKPKIMSTPFKIGGGR